MKRLFRFGIVSALAAVALGVSTVFADVPGPTGATYTSGIYVANRSTTNAAAVVLDFYNASGGAPVGTYSLGSVAAGGVAYVFVGTNPAGLPAGVYSVVASSDQDIVALGNTWGSKTVPAGTAAIRDSFVSYQQSDVSKILYAPVLESNYYGFSSNVMIQNTDSAAGTVTVTVRSAIGANQGTILQTYVYPITALGAVAFDVTTASPALPSGNTTGLFSAKIESTVNMAAIASTSSSVGASADGNNPNLLHYPLKSAGSETLYVAKNLKNFYGFISSLSIQNLGSVATTAYVTYTTSSGPVYASFPIAANSTAVDLTFLNPNLPSGNANGIFPAIISANQPLIAIIQPLSGNVQPDGDGDLSASVAAGTTDLATSLFVPVAFKNYTGLSGSSLYSSLTFVNPGGTPGSITVKANSVAGTPQMTLPIAANGGQASTTLNSAGAFSTLPVNSVTSLSIESTVPIFCVIGINDNNNNGTIYGDYNIEFNAIK